MDKRTVPKASYHRAKKSCYLQRSCLPTGSLDVETKLPDEKSQLDYYRVLKQSGTSFVYFEAFDQVWKTHNPVEPFWGYSEVIDRRN